MFEHGIIAGIIAYIFALVIVPVIGKRFGGEKGKTIALCIDIYLGFYWMVDNLKNDATFGVNICIISLIIVIKMTIDHINTPKKREKILKNLDSIVTAYINQNGYHPLWRFQTYCRESPSLAKERKYVKDLVERLSISYVIVLKKYEFKRIPDLIDKYISEYGCRPIKEFEKYCNDSPDFESSRSIKYNGKDFLSYAVSYYKVETNKKRDDVLNKADSIVKTYIEQNGYQPLWKFQKDCQESLNLAEERKYVEDLAEKLLPNYENELRTHEINRIPFVVDKFIEDKGYKSPHVFKSFCIISEQLKAANSIKYQYQDPNNKGIDYPEYAVHQYRPRVNTKVMEKLVSILSPKIIDHFNLDQLYKKIPEFQEFFLDENGEMDKSFFAKSVEILLNNLLERKILEIELPGDTFKTIYQFHKSNNSNNSNKEESGNIHVNIFNDSDLGLDQDDD